MITHSVKEMGQQKEQWGSGFPTGVENMGGGGGGGGGADSGGGGGGGGGGGALQNLISGAWVKRWGELVEA